MEVFSSRIHEWFLKGPSKGYSLSRPFLPLCQSSKDFIPSKGKLTGIGPFTGKAVGQAVGTVHEVKEWRSLRGKSGRRNKYRAGKTSRCPLNAPCPPWQSPIVPMAEHLYSLPYDLPHLSVSDFTLFISS